MEKINNIGIRPLVSKPLIGTEFGLDERFITDSWYSQSILNTRGYHGSLTRGTSLIHNPSTIAPTF